MKTKEEKILKRDDRLLKREKSWRRARVGVTILSILGILTIFKIYGNSSIPQDMKLGSIATCFLWLLILDFLNNILIHRLCR